MGIDSQVEMLTTLHEEIPHHVWKMFKAIHLTIATISLVCNSLAVLVLYCCCRGLTPTLRLCTLGWFAQLLLPWAVYTTYLPHSTCQHEVHSALVLCSHNALVVVLLGHIVFLYVHTLHPMKADDWLCPTRMWLGAATGWLLGFLAAFSPFLITLIWHNHEESTCSQIEKRTPISVVISLCLLVILLITSAAVCLRIRCFLRPLHLAISDPQECPRSTEDLVTVLVLLLLHFCTWIPYLIATLMHSYTHNTDAGYPAAFALLMSIVLVLLQSLMMPIVLAIRVERIYDSYRKACSTIRLKVRQKWKQLKEKVEREDTAASALNPIETVC